MIEENKFLQEYSWQGLRDKLRNLKAKYKMATDWKGNTNASLQESDDSHSIEEYIEKICPFFNELDNLWGTKPNFEIPKQEPDPFYNYNNETETADSGMEFKFEVPDEETVVRQRLDSPPAKNPKEGETSMGQMQEKWLIYLKKKLEWEKEHGALKLQLEKEKLDLEREKMEREMMLKEKALKIHFDLEKMRMELKKQELRLKK